MIPPSPARKSYDILITSEKTQENLVQGMFDINLNRGGVELKPTSAESFPTEGLRRLAPFREHLDEGADEGCVEVCGIEDLFNMSDVAIV